MDFFEVCHCLVAVCVLSCSQNKKTRRTTETNKEQNLDTPGNAEKEQAKELNMDALEAASGGYTTYSDPGRALLWNPVRSLTTSPARIMPAAATAKAVEPGMARRWVHFRAVPGGQMQ